MANYATLKAAISQVIKENGNKEITGAVMQTTLLAMVDSMASGYTFAGVATPYTSAGTPDENVFWIGGAGSYSNFGATTINVPTGCICIFTYNGSFASSILYVGGVVDISKLNNTSYASLSQALADVPSFLQVGGIEVMYQDSTSGKYVKYRLMNTSWSTTITYWQGGDTTPTPNSKNLVESGGVFSMIKDIASLEESVKPTYTNGFYTINGTSTTTSGYSKALLNVSGGDIYYLTGRVGQDAHMCLAVAFNSNDEVIGYYGVGSYSEVKTYDNLEVIIPNGCVKLGVSYYGSYGKDLTKKIHFVTAEETDARFEEIEDKTKSLSYSWIEVPVVWTNAKLYDNGGNVANAPTANQRITSVAVSQGEKYKISLRVYNIYGIWGLMLANVTGGTTTIVERKFQSTEGTFNDYVDQDIVIPEGVNTLLINYYYNLTVPFTLTKKTDTIEIIEKDIEDLQSSQFPLKNKVIVNFGDSIIGNTRPPQDVSTYLSQKTGAICYNCGFGGCRMASAGSTSPWTQFSMYKLAEAILNNDWSGQDAAIADSSWTDKPLYFPETLALLKSIDWSTVDYITIEYGTNDWTSNYLINENDKYDVTTFAGAMRTSIEKLQQACPQARIIIWSPTWRFFMNNGEYETDTHQPESIIHSAGYLMEALIAKEEEICKEYGLQFINNHDTLGWNEYSRLTYFNANDGTHPKPFGNAEIAAHVAKVIF